MSDKRTERKYRICEMLTEKLIKLNGIEITTDCIFPIHGRYTDGCRYAQFEIRYRDNKIKLYLPRLETFTYIKSNDSYVNYPYKSVDEVVEIVTKLIGYEASMEHPNPGYNNQIILDLYDLLQSRYDDDSKFTPMVKFNEIDGTLELYMGPGMGYAKKIHFTDGTHLAIYKYEIKPSDTCSYNKYDTTDSNVLYEIDQYIGEALDYMWKREISTKSIYDIDESFINTLPKRQLSKLMTHVEKVRMLISGTIDHMPTKIDDE